MTWALDRGARRVVLTLGADGAVLATPDDSCTCRPARSTVRDTTGCGDAVVGGLLAALLAGLRRRRRRSSSASSPARRTPEAMGSDAGVAGLAALAAAARTLPVRPSTVIGSDA